MGLICGIQRRGERRGSGAATATGYGHLGNTIWGLPKIMGGNLGGGHKTNDVL